MLPEGVMERECDAPTAVAREGLGVDGHHDCGTATINRAAEDERLRVQAASSRFRQICAAFSSLKQP
eukprot:15465744-Alexandrium_andersonii.AAC.1